MVFFSLDIKEFLTLQEHKESYNIVLTDHGITDLSKTRQVLQRCYAAGVFLFVCFVNLTQAEMSKCQ